MSKHDNCKMICAKATNMELVVFGKSLKWYEVDADDFQFFNQHYDYFLCLPEHKEACLAWLNGADVQEKGINASDEWWSDQTADVIWSKSWHEDHVFMNDCLMFRVKPRKERRWIGVRAKDGLTTNAKNTKQYAEDEVGIVSGEWQFIEIEVEV